MNEPKVRFKGFEGEWEEKKLGDCVDFLDTMRKPIEETNRVKGNYPYYGASGIVDYINDFIFDEELILLSEDGANITERKYPICFLAKGKYWVNNHAHVLRSKDSYDNKYLCNVLESKDYTQYNTGMAMPKLNKDVCLRIPFYAPTLPEQRRIASYFTHLDTLIEASRQKVEKLKQVKAASLQSLFPAHGERVPKIRFKGCEGEWKKVKLNSFAKRVARKNTHLESTLALTIASAYGLISQKDYFNNSVVGANIRNYYLLKKGEFAYNKSYSNGFPFGSVKRLDKYEQGILSTLYIVFSIDDSIDSDYLCHFFDTALWYNDVAERATEGARNHGLLNIGAEEFLDIDIILPVSLPEQRRIASYFTHLDTLLTLERARYAKLQQVKRASLTQMFA